VGDLNDDPGEMRRERKEERKDSSANAGKNRRRRSQLTTVEVEGERSGMRL